MSNALVWNETLKSRLRQAREHNSISQAKAAEAIGVESNTLWRWENGYVKKIPMAGLCGLAEVYDVSVGWLTGQQDALSPEEQELVQMYRNAPQGFRRSILAALRAWLDAPNDYEAESTEEGSRLLEVARL